MASMMNFNPAGYAIPLQHQTPFALGREGTPQQPYHYQQPFYPNQNVSAPYPLPQISQPALPYPPHPFDGGSIPAHADGGGGFVGGAMIQSGLPNHYPVSSQPSYTNSPYAQNTLNSGTPTNFPPYSVPASSVPMAAPSQSPMSQIIPQQPIQRMNVGGQQQMPLQRPLSPTSAAREKSRVSTLLEINSALLQEVVSLQAQGKAGAPSNAAAPPGQTSPSQSTPTDPAVPSPTTSTPTIETPTDPATGKSAPKAPTREYVDCMRRLQANLAYLATIADRAKKPGAPPPQPPQIMDPPAHMQTMVEPYSKLKELFPDAGRTGQQGQQPTLQQRMALQGQRPNAGMAMPGTA